MSFVHRSSGIAGRVAVGAGWLVMIAAAATLLVPTLLGFDRYVIVSGSMVPTFSRGSIVFDKPVPVSQLKVGDVVTYRPPASTGVDHLVSHRISSIAKAEDGTRVFRTRGDANPSNDPWTFQLNAPTQNVMRFTIPLLGYPLLALSDAHGRMLLIGIPAAIIGLMALVDLTRELLARRHLRVAAG